MKVKKTVPLKDLKLVGCVTNGSSLQLIIANPHAEIITIDPDSMAAVNRFFIATEPHLDYHACVDDNCIYLPTISGQILVIDKFSGDIFENINLGSVYISSDILQNDERIYCIGGVPINSHHTLNTSRFCAYICNKETGNQEIQTNYFQGMPLFLSIEKNKMWISAGNYLLRYNQEGENEIKVYLSQAPDYPPIAANGLLHCVYRTGLIKILNPQNLTGFDEFYGKPAISPPLLINNSLFWLMERGMCKVDLQKRVVETLQTNKQMAPTPLVAVSERKVIGCTIDGSILSFDMTTRKINAVKLADKGLWKPMIVEGDLFVISPQGLHKIEI